MSEIGAKTEQAGAKIWAKDAKKEGQAMDKGCIEALSAGSETMAKAKAQARARAVCIDKAVMELVLVAQKLVVEQGREVAQEPVAEVHTVAVVGEENANSE